MKASACPIYGISISGFKNRGCLYLEIFALITLKIFELNLNKANMNDLKRKIYRNFAELGIGREIIMIAMKK